MCWTTFILLVFLGSEALGASFLSAYSWLYVALGLAQMVLDVWKTLKPAQFIILDNFYFNNCLTKSIPGDVRAQVLQDPVGASHADQGRKSGVLSNFLGPGVKRNPTVPHTWP